MSAMTPIENVIQRGETLLLSQWTNEHLNLCKWAQGSWKELLPSIAEPPRRIHVTGMYIWSWMWPPCARILVSKEGMSFEVWNDLAPERAMWSWGTFLFQMNKLQPENKR